MGAPLGKAPSEGGAGTTPRDLQRIIGASFMTPGVVPNGGLTVEGTSSMAYKVNPGAVVLLSSTDGRATIAAIEETIVNTIPAPATGSRVDSVYVDHDGAVRVANSAVIPGGVSIGRFTVPAGITATNAAPQSLDRNFAIPVGASLGLLHQFHDPANGIKGNVSPMTLGSGRFFLPSDRLVRFDLTHCLSAIQESNSDQPSAAIRWRVYIDRQLELAFTTRVTRAAPQTNFMSFTVSLGEGAHDVYYVQDQIEGLSGPGWMHHKGTAQGYPGNRFEVWDAGASR